MKKLTSVAILLIIFIGLSIIFQAQKNSPSQQPTPSPAPTLIATSSAQPKQVLGVRTKVSGCIAQNALPDKDCTPGAIILGVTKEQVCTPGYSKEVRNVPNSEKEQVFAEYGITSHNLGEYEVDHLISLELGGSNDISNLWPEAAEPRPGYHEKDKVENILHQQICNSTITLDQAQQ